MKNAKNMKNLKKRILRKTVEAYGCAACTGTVEGCMAACNGDFNALQRGIQAQLDIQYLTIYA